MPAKTKKHKSKKVIQRKRSVIRRKGKHARKLAKLNLVKPEITPTQQEA